MTIKANPFARGEAHYYFVIALIVFYFLTGGGSRSDIWSLAIIRPVSILAAGYGLCNINRALLTRHKWFMWAFISLFAITLIHLVPLPPALWQSLPGRELVMDIDTAAGIGAIWRPLTLVPSGTWNALFSLFVPLSIFVNAIQLSDTQLRRLLPVFLGIGALSCIIGILQLSGNPHGPLFFYAQTNFGASVGLFANRNHQGVFLACLFPMLSVYATARGGKQLYRKWGSVFFAGMLVPLLLATGSRAGGALGLVGLIAGIYFYWKYNKTQDRARRSVKAAQWRTSGALLAIVGLVGVTLIAIVSSRSETLARLVAEDPIQDLRFKIWDQSLALVGSYFPVGSGVGTFIEVYKAAETPTTTFHNYVNHVHNDWIEIVLTAGLPGLVFLIAILAKYIWSVVKAFARSQGASGHWEQLFVQMALFVVGLLMIASIGDYPLRTPALQSFLVVALLWAGLDGYGTSRESTRLEATI